MKGIKHTLVIIATPQVGVFTRNLKKGGGRFLLCCIQMPYTLSSLSSLSSILTTVFKGEGEGEGETFKGRQDMAYI